MSKKEFGNIIVVKYHQRKGTGLGISFKSRVAQLQHKPGSEKFFFKEFKREVLSKIDFGLTTDQKVRGFLPVQAGNPCGSTVTIDPDDFCCQDFPLTPTHCPRRDHEGSTCKDCVYE